MEDNGRSYWIDNIRSLLMYLIITGHFAIIIMNKSDSMTLYRQLISMFHMPAFMIITGMMAKRRINDERYGDITKRIFLPYVICNFIMFIIFQSLGVSKVSGIEQTGRFVVLQPYYFLWFLLAVFIFSIITPQFKKLGMVKHLIITFILALLSGYGNKIVYIQLSKIIPFYFYFSIGYYLDLVKLKLLLKKELLRVISIVIFAISFYICIKYRNFIDVSIFSMEKQYYELENIFISPLIVRSLVLLSGVLLALAFYSIVPEKQNKLSYIGKYSIYPYCIHTFIMPFMFYSIDRKRFYSIDTFIEYLAAFIVCFIVMIIITSKPIRKIFSYILEQKIKILKILNKKTERGTVHDY